jgi:glyoxylase-like metal-dependent hydrolase (beta-lactamase superfamily II)
MHHKPGKAIQITQEIFQVGGNQLTAPEDAAVYLINFAGHAALVDAGCGNAAHRLLANIQSCGIDFAQIEFLLITHCHYDHTGGVKGLRDKMHFKIVAHALEAPFLEQGDNHVTAAHWYGAKIRPFQVDRKITGAREALALGDRTIQAIHTPGHSPGSMVYLTESEGMNVLFGQDIHGPIHPDLKSNPEDYQRSLQLMLALEADILCEGHYGVYRGRESVAAFIRQFMKGR